MKRIFAFVFVAVMLLCTALPAFAVVEITEIDAPYSIKYSVYDDSSTVAEHGCERIVISCLFTDAFVAFTGLDEQTRLEKYGMTNVYSYLQVDYRIDGGKWQADEVWETTPGASPLGQMLNAGATMKNFDIFYLNNESTRKEAGALIKEDEGGKYVFDLDNHSFEFRLRVSLCYTKDEMSRVIVSDWSDTFNVERGVSFGEQPKTLEPPVLSEAKVGYSPTDEMPYLVFKVTVPESVKEAASWFASQMIQYPSLACYMKSADGTWSEVSASGADYFSTEYKYIYLSESDLDESKNIQIKMAYSVYTNNGGKITSKESNTVSFSTPRWTAEKGITHDKCKVCGVCRPIFGICMFVWLAILIVIGIIVFVVIKTARDKKAVLKAIEEEERLKAEEAAHAAKKAEKEAARKRKH